MAYNFDCSECIKFKFSFFFTQTKNFEDHKYRININTIFDTEFVRLQSFSLIGLFIPTISQLCDSSNLKNLFNYTLSSRYLKRGGGYSI